MKKQVIEKFGEKYYLLGKDMYDNKVWLQESNFDCNWYYGIGYVEVFNKSYTDIDLHTHFDSLFFNGEKCCYDLFNEYFTETTLTDTEVWQLLELMKTLYSCRNFSDMLHLKGSHITTNKTEKELFGTDIYKNEYNRLNFEIIPKLLDEVYKILKGDE